ncbi:MAG: chromate efflux transporter [Pseudomonas sp.]
MTDSATDNRNPWSVFLIFLRLGLISFGGPVAHLGYLREEFVTRRRWLSERNYVDLIALCQFLPGPASSQVGIALGLSRAGYAGALAAWAGFTLPSAITLMLLAQGIASHGEVLSAGMLHGLKVVAVAVVAQAIWGMARTLCSDGPRICLMLIAAGITLMVPTAWAPVGVIVAAAIAGLVLFKATPPSDFEPMAVAISRRNGAVCLLVFFSLLVGLPLVSVLWPRQTLAMVDAFYRSGSLVFGGGHVVLPLLQSAVVPTGWVTREVFMAGYGAVQAMPGPLFTFAAFLGASMTSAPSGWSGGLLCLIAIFLPAFLLIVGALPYWEQLRRNTRMQMAMGGVNAAVVGLLLAAFYQPVWSSAIENPRDIVIAIVALIALMFWKLPPWLVVIGTGATGWWLG